MRLTSRPYVLARALACATLTVALAASLPAALAVADTDQPPPAPAPTDPADPTDTPDVSSPVPASDSQRAPEDMPWLDASRSPAERADLLVAAMTHDQLLHMVHGQSDLLGNRISHADGPPSIGYIPPIPELRVPALILTDGPAGLRNGEKATKMPAPITQAASFDLSLARAYGSTIATDAKDRGQDVLFSPGFNLARNPRAGRTFEYFGEDPLLAGRVAAAHVDGVQSAGVMATIKHYVANNQETNRTLNSSAVDERTLHEIYEEPFRIAVRDAKPAAVMCAYNRVNGVPACGSSATLTDDLRHWMGFDGFVVTDYPAAWSPTDLRAGLNVELPWQFWTKPKRIERAIAAGQLSWDDIRQRVREVLTQMFRFGLFDQGWDEAQGDRVRPLRDLDHARGNAVAQRAAEEGSVLLKNDGMLPLSAPEPGKTRRVLVVGYAAKSTATGWGSSAGKSEMSDSTLERLAAHYGPNTVIEWAGQGNPARIARQAKLADEVIVVASSLWSELLDRPNLRLAPAQENAIAIAARNNPRVAVVLQTGGPLIMPWLDKVQAVLNVWYPGQAGGEATANLLFGKVAPSGRLPQTFPASPSEVPASTREQFPGAKAGFEARYTEGVFMGYRWWGEHGKTPAFPFGYGLTYTTFSYGDVTVSGPGTRDGDIRVSVEVTNTGSRSGAVVPQVYIGKPDTPETPTPPRELAAFTKVTLAPGETKRVNLTVAADTLGVWDSHARDRVVRPGTYTVAVADNALAPASEHRYTVR